MQYILTLALCICLATYASAQHYERDWVCGNDTLTIEDDFDMKRAYHSPYKAFQCTRVSKLGVRVDIGFNRNLYNAKTKAWLGNHNGALLGLSLAYGDFNLGAHFKLATVVPKTVLTFDGVVLDQQAKLNPVKTVYDISYSRHMKANFCIEPFVGVTRHQFLVINEDEIEKVFEIDRVNGFTTGAALTKYFKVKELEYVAVFVKYGYSFSDFRKVDSSLGFGCSDLLFGLAYKRFGKNYMLKRL